MKNILFSYKVRISPIMLIYISDLLVTSAGAIVGVIAWELQLPVQSVPIITKVVRIKISVGFSRCHFCV